MCVYFMLLKFFPSSNHCQFSVGTTKKIFIQNFVTYVHDKLFP